MRPEQFDNVSRVAEMLHVAALRAPTNEERLVLLGLEVLLLRETERVVGGELDVTRAA
jgi:hypothetical protein